MTKPLSDPELDALADVIVERLITRMQSVPPIAQEMTLTPEQLGKRLGRSAKWVRRRCALRQIHTVTRRPYRIPTSEAERLTR